MVTVIGLMNMLRLTTLRGGRWFSRKLLAVWQVNAKQMLRLH
jgi:hypothetical protein